MKQLSLSLLIVLLPACIGPKYQKPTHQFPNIFKHSCTDSTQEPFSKWWYQFNDSTLNNLIEQALENNYDMRIAIERIEESRALYQFKQAQRFPQIDGIGAARRTRFSKSLAQTSFLQNSNVSFFQLGTDAFWEFDFFGRLRKERNAQFFAFQAQIEATRNVSIILLAEVAQIYINLCSFSKKIDLLKQKISLDNKLVTLQTDLYTSGLVSQINVVTQQQILATDRDKLERLIIDYNRTLHQLAALLGMNPEELSLAPLRKSIPLSTYTITTGIPSDLIRRRPDIRQAERTIASKNESVAAATAEWFPRFTLFSGLSSEASNGSSWFTGNSLSWFIGPSFRWPIINFGRIKANINVEESKRRQAILTYSNSIINALKDVEDFLVSYCHNKEQLLILAEKYKQAFQQERLNKYKFKAGLTNMLNVLNARSNLINVALEIAQASQNLSNSLVGLYKALGGGW